MKRKSSIPFQEIPDQERSLRSLPVRNDRSGMTMLEIVISLFIIGIAAVVSASIIISAFQGNRLNKNKLIAISLAREGIEAVRNMRDSNWLRYTANKDECWNFWENPEESTPITTCDTASPNRITAGYYKVNIGRYDLGPSFAPPTPPYTYKWYLSGKNDPSSSIDTLNMKDNLDDLNKLKLKLWTPDSTNYPDYALYVDNTHTGSGNAETNFYRQIQIEYIDTDKSGTPDVDDESLQVTSTVVWFEKGQQKKVKLISRLSNYMD